MLRLIKAEQIQDLIHQAALSPRKRSHYNVHQSHADPVQKMFIAACRASYFRPHRHATKSEFALIIQGQFKIFLFDDNGKIALQQTVGAGSGVPAFEIPANIWHCWLALDDEAVFFETKQGPYHAESAAEFPRWAPPEDSTEARRFLHTLQTTG